MATATLGNAAADREIEASFDDFADSALESEYETDTTSITSNIYKGHIENGRRYQATRDEEAWVPSDEKQFESQQSVHLLHLILDSHQKNPLFRSPVSDKVQNILDLGTGNGAWAQEAADRFPGALVQGIDLYPPPATWIPPNCVFTVEDALKPWLFKQHFDLIHLRWLYGSFTESQWEGIYQQAYDNLAPGGWIEQIEPDIHFRSDDGTLPADSIIAGWGQMMIDACSVLGKPLNVADTFHSRITNFTSSSSGGNFQNIQEKIYKVPYGSWTRHPVLKEVGRINKDHFLQGMEGYAMLVLTKFGPKDGKPWSSEEVRVFLDKVRGEMERGWHTYFILKRVWAQKPLE